MLSFQVGLEFSKVVNITKGQISVLTRSVASKVRRAVVENTPVDKGEAKKAWTPVRKDEGGYSFENPTIQAYFLEYGSEKGKRPWPNTGLRTVYYQGRVYSSQAPQGITAQANVEELAVEVAQELFNELVEKQ
jgi:hypothetical protein